MPLSETTRVNAALRIYDEIRSDILLGRIAVGEKLTERKLMLRFFVSRTPVREALKVLEREGWVKSLSKSGTTVTSLEPRDISEIFAVRMVLEPLAVSLAVTRLGDRERADIGALLAAVENAAGAGDRVELLRCDAEVHFWIARASGNSLLAKMIGDLTGQIVRLGDASTSQPGRAEGSQAELTRLLTALAEGRGVDASNAMLIHLANSSVLATKTAQARLATHAAAQPPAAGRSPTTGKSPAAAESDVSDLPAGGA